MTDSLLYLEPEFGFSTMRNVYPTSQRSYRAQLTASTERVRCVG
jgi:hypothetical protein